MRQRVTAVPTLNQAHGAREVTKDPQSPFEVPLIGPGTPKMLENDYQVFSGDMLIAPLDGVGKQSLQPLDAIYPVAVRVAGGISIAAASAGPMATTSRTALTTYGVTAPLKAMRLMYASEQMGALR
ncbi:hypothetical protein SAMN05443545_102224 [Aidingimonas halophila]|uniref:Uncharacterized protein n=1 Tax=Aidingimonas halophila TaxID=574349 RepID=A0A1H2URY6_9GAMM|nr:hypothetical protein GCM10008094_12240 [Aidingimonas halophila]SDW58862.1 hypothetical protein SAMN05443545_102224 [Aidingimonas halophila]